MKNLEVVNPSKQQIELSKNRLLRHLIVPPCSEQEIKVKLRNLSYPKLIEIATKNNIKYSIEIFDAIIKSLNSQLPQLPELPIKLNNFTKILYAKKSIFNFVKEKSIKHWIDYELYSFKFSKSYKFSELQNFIEEEIKRKITYKVINIKNFDCYLVNTEKKSLIEGVKLIYSTYEGLLTIVPIGKGYGKETIMEIDFNHMIPNHESYIEFYNKVLLEVWGSITNYKKHGTYKRNKGL